MSTFIRKIEDGWIRAAWAQSHILEDGDNDTVTVHWNRDAAAVIAIKNYRDGSDRLITPSLSRTDDVQMNLEQGTMQIETGETMIYVHDDLELSPGEARKLAAALVDLADILEATS